MNAPANQAPARLLDSRTGWAMVAIAFVSSFTVYGIAYSFGAFFKPMIAEFGATRSATSAVFSITAFIYFMLGPATGHLSDRFGPRVVLAFGATAMGAGLLLTSSIHSLWLGYVTYGVGVGIGVSCGYLPMIASVGGWFLRRRTAALGIAVAGIGCGTLFVAPMAAFLIGRYGWRATDVMFGIGGATILFGCAWLAQPPPFHVVPTEFRPRDALQTPAFGMLYMSTLFGSIALYLPFVYLPDFARHHGSGEVAAAALVGIIGAASLAGRIGLGALGERGGVIRLYQVCYLVMALSFGVWMLAINYPMLILFALAMGSAYGGYVALSPAVVAHLYGTGRLGIVLGVLYTSCGIGALVGPPLAGLIIDRTGSFRLAIGFAFAAAAASYAILLPLNRYEPRNAAAANLRSALAGSD